MQRARQLDERDQALAQLQRRVSDVSAEAPCAGFHKPLSRGTQARLAVVLLDAVGGAGQVHSHQAGRLGRVAAADRLDEPLVLLGP